MTVPRTLFESVMMPNIITALRDWGKVQAGGVLIGALALSYYARPRMTQDVDFLFRVSVRMFPHRCPASHGPATMSSRTMEPR